MLKAATSQGGEWWGVPGAFKENDSKRSGETKSTGRERWEATQALAVSLFGGEETAQQRVKRLI